MAPVPGGILFIHLSLRKGEENTSLAARVADDVQGVSRRYPCGLPFVAKPSLIVIGAGEEPMDDGDVRQLAEEVRHLLVRLREEYPITDFRVTTE